MISDQNITIFRN